MTRSPSLKYVDALEASAMLGGLLNANAVRTMARRGQVPGAVLANRRIWIPRAAVAAMVTDLASHPMPTADDPLLRRSRHATAFAS